MRKLFFSCIITSVLTLSFVSCKDGAKPDSGEMESNTIEATDETSTDSDTTENISTPSFGDADVQAYVDAYDSYLTDYKKAVENKDMEAFAALATKGQDLGNKAQEISGKVSGSDAERLAAYMTKKATEIQELSKKMME